MPSFDSAFQNKNSANAQGAIEVPPSRSRLAERCSNDGRDE